MADKKKEPKPKVHKDLDGFEMRIDSFGEIKSSFSIDKLNDFLNDNVKDKKLKDRDDLPFDPLKDNKGEENN